MKSVQIRSFFWSIFSCILNEYRDLLRKSSYSVWIQENTDQKNSVFGHFSRSAYWLKIIFGLYQQQKKKMIGWLRQIKQNHWCKFLIFSIKKFYISRDEDRIQKALYFAEANTFISFDDKFITHHAKSLLFNKEETWIKRETGFNDVGKSLRHDLPEQFEKKIFLLVRRVSSFQK